MAWIPEEYERRPKDVDFELADYILDRLANGENLYSICTNDPDYPMPATFLRWVEEDPSLQEKHAWALRVRTELLVEGMLQVADGLDAKIARNKLDARRFHAERLMPGKYGPRAFQVNVAKEEDPGAGIDYGAEVRRKLEAMADRSKAAQRDETVASGK